MPVRHKLNVFQHITSFLWLTVCQFNKKNAFLEQVVKSGSSVVQLSVTVLQFQVSVFGNVVCIVIMAFWLRPVTNC